MVVARLYIFLHTHPCCCLRPFPHPQVEFFNPLDYEGEPGSQQPLAAHGSSPSGGRDRRERERRYRERNERRSGAGGDEEDGEEVRA